MRRPLLLAAICLVLAMGFLLHLGVFDRTPKGQTGADALSDGESLAITGQVYQKDSEKLYLRSIQIYSSAEFSQPAIPCKDNLICILEQEADVPLGCVVLATGTFQPFPGATNPGEFDSREYYRTLGIGGRVKSVVVLAQGESFWELREALYQLRRALGKRLEKIFPEKEAAVMCALLLGDKEDLDPGLKELFQRNGILHILSISSLHITMIGMTVYKLLRRCRIPVCPAAIAGCGFLFLYGMMTGFGVSSYRALGMYLLRMLAEVIGRTYDMPTALGVLGAVLVVKNPYYLRHTGFLLSFTSMAGVCAAASLKSAKPPAERRRERIPFRRWGNAPGGCMAGGRKPGGLGAEGVGTGGLLAQIAGTVKDRLADSALSGTAITLATLPVQLWSYYQVPSYSVLLNILILPFMKILMGAGGLALVPGLGICGWADRLILWGYEGLCGIFDSFPYHTWNPGKPRLWQIGVYYTVFGAAVWGRKYLGNKCRHLQKGMVGGREKDSSGRNGQNLQENLQKFRKYKGGAIACLAAMLFGPVIFAWRPPAENQLLFLDVGQGDCILVRTASGENYLFDCGSSSRNQAGKYVLLPCLRYYGIQTLDAAVLSHPDADHVNGVMELLSMGRDSGVRVRQLVLPGVSEAEREKMLSQLGQYAEQEDWGCRIPIGYLAAGDSFRCGRAEFVCLHPPGDWGMAEPNAYSLCVYGRFTDEDGEKEFDFLATGDVEGAGEEALLAELRERGIGSVSLLKVAHHGSKNSTPETLLEQAAPALAVISCGRDNRYGHPHQEVLERLDKAGSITVATSGRGAVRVYAGQGMIMVETYLTAPTGSGSPHSLRHSYGRF